MLLPEEIRPNLAATMRSYKRRYRCPVFLPITRHGGKAHRPLRHQERGYIKHEYQQGLVCLSEQENEEEEVRRLERGAAIFLVSGDSPLTVPSNGML